MVVSQDVDELTYFSNITFLSPQINIFFKSDSIPFAPIGCPNFMQNKTKYTMDPGIYFLMKTNKSEIEIKVLKMQSCWYYLVLVSPS